MTNMSTLHAVMERPESSFAPTRQTRAASFRLLVADDQQEVVDAIRLLLSTLDIEVVGATTPGEAVNLARAQSFDAAMIDLNYGKGHTSGEQGLDLLSTLRARQPSLPVIVMTAFNTSTLPNEALRRGARDVVEKPWDEARLIMIVRTHVELGRALRQLSALEAENRELRGGNAPSPDAWVLPNGSMRLFDVEGRLVRQAMTQHQGNVSRAAKTLGLSRSALYRRLERHKV
jgi:DNA-binding NtrC family response regulator